MSTPALRAGVMGSQGGTRSCRCAGVGIPACTSLLRTATFEGIVRLAVTPGSAIRFTEEPDRVLRDLATALSVEGIEAHAVSDMTAPGEDGRRDLVVLYLASHVDTLTNDTFEYRVERVMGIARRWAEAQLGERAQGTETRAGAPSMAGATPSPVATIEDNAQALEVDADGRMSAVLRDVIGWLETTDDIGAVRQARSVLADYEVFIRRRNLSPEARLGATEGVRRCERRMGELMGRGRKGYQGHRLMAAVGAARFELAVEEARAEGNLSRANIVRKIKSTAEITTVSQVRDNGRAQPARTGAIVVEFRRSDGSLVQALEIEQGLDGPMSVAELPAGPDVPSRPPPPQVLEWFEGRRGRVGKSSLGN
jgi:hypothetical protein